MEPRNTADDHDTLDLIWTAPAIARALNLTTRQATYMLETGKLPATKIGKKWVADRHALRRYFAAALSGQAA